MWGRMYNPDITKYIKKGDRVRWKGQNSKGTGIVQSNYCGSCNILQDGTNLAFRIYEKEIISVQSGATGPYREYQPNALG